MSALLDLATHYYAVADDLRRNAAEQVAIADRLAAQADALCEQNVRETAAKPCKIMEYDGAYKCASHHRQWGAITDPDEPCAGWVKP